MSVGCTRRPEPSFVPPIIGPYKVLSCAIEGCAHRLSAKSPQATWDAYRDHCEHVHPCALTTPEAA